MIAQLCSKNDRTLVKFVSCKQLVTPTHLLTPHTNLNHCATQPLLKYQKGVEQGRNVPINDCRWRTELHRGHIICCFILFFSGKNFIESAQILIKIGCQNAMTNIFFYLGILNCCFFYKITVRKKPHFKILSTFTSSIFSHRGRKSRRTFLGTTFDVEQARQIRI